MRIKFLPWLAVMALVACSLPQFKDEGRLDIHLSLDAGVWTTSASTQRFLTPETTAVNLEVRTDGATGPVVATAILTVGKAGSTVGATGTLEKLPVGKLLTLAATITDANKAVLSQASSEVTLASNAVQTVNLVLMPTPNHPNLLLLTPGISSISIPNQTTKILEFNADDTAYTLSWDTGSWPGLASQVRNATGAVVSSTPFGTAPNTGISFPTTPGQTTYVLIYNQDTVPATSVSFDLQPKSPFVAVNALGEAYRQTSGTGWSGPFSTGLTLANDLVFANNLFVAVGQTVGGNYGISTSPDGKVWTLNNLGGSSAQIMRVAANPAGQMVATGYFGASTETFLSTDGLSWALTGATGIAGGIVGPAWDGAAWYIANGNLSTVKTSTNGVSWNTTTGTTPGMYGPQTMIGLPGKIMIGGGAPSNTNKQIITTVDGGATYSALTNVGTATHYISAFAADLAMGTVLAVGSGTSQQVLITSDFGTTWTPITGTTSNNYRAAFHWSGGWLVGDSAGNIYFCDGTTLTARGTAGSAEIRGLAYSKP